MRRDVAGDDGARCHHRVSTHRDAGKNDAARSEAGAAFDPGRQQPSGSITVALGNRREQHARTSRQRIVRKRYPGADKDVIVDLDTAPYHCLILDGDPIPYPAP
jgi:hypothetical protein